MDDFSDYRDALLAIFPLTAEVDNSGHLRIGGCDTGELTARFGTPLYVFDELTLRRQCAEFKGEFGKHYPRVLVIYACKAFINPALAAIFAAEGLGLDVVSSGELAIARSMDFPAENIYFHGNNKSRDELEEAAKHGVGRIVVDGFHELSLLNEVAGEKGLVQDILLRVSPGVDSHTHAHITTGTIDSKFGFPLATGQAEEALQQAVCASNLNLLGLHCHIGSQVFEIEPYLEAIDLVLNFAAEMSHRHGFELMEFSPGGGFAVQYVRGSSAPPVSSYAQAIGEKIIALCGRLELPLPRLIVEPGRRIVGQAGVALYSVGSTKEIPGVRKYVSVDGGMGDNIRPALYEAVYEVLLANRAIELPVERVTVAGRFCESGDILAKDALLPPVAAGDIIAVPASGAYSPAMASNYNAFPRPAIVMVRDGEVRQIRRRETYQDLMKCDTL